MTTDFQAARRFLRRMTLSGLVDATVAVLRGRFWGLVGLWFYCSLPVMLAVPLLALPLGLSVALPEPGAEREPLPAFAWMLTAVAAVLLLWGVWRTVKYLPAAIRMVDATVRGQSIAVRPCYRSIPARLALRSVWLAIIAGGLILALLAVPTVLAALYPDGYEAIRALIVFVGLVLSVVAGLWWAFAIVALVLEGTTGADAYRRARVLMRRQYWRLLLVYGAIAILANILNAAALGGMGVMSAVSEGAIGEQAASIAFTVLSTLLFGALTAGAFVAASVVAFYESRVRLEGLDLRMQMDEMEAVGSSP